MEVSRRFDAPREAVFDVYTDHARWSEWAGTGPSRLLQEGSPDRNGVGAIRRLGPPPFAAREEVTGFERPARMIYRVIGGGLPMRDHRGEVAFEADGAGTRVVWRCRFASRIPGIGGLQRRIVEAIFRRALEGLARHRFPDGP